MGFLIGLFSLFLPSAMACNPYMSPDSPHYNPMKFQYVITPQVGGGITQDEYAEILYKVKNYYDPIVSAQGGELNMVDQWRNDGVNGYATRNGNRWNVEILGGYARHKLSSKEAVAFLTCHEMGHHLGGTPRLGPWLGWASAEGQSDYFASLKCVRHIYRDDDNEAAVAALDVPEFLRAKCEQQFANRLDQFLCIRGAMGGYLMTKIWENGGGHFQFDTPSPHKVTYTTTGHPESQCRIDTYLQGSLCEIPAHVDVSNSDPLVGTCNKSTGHKVGFRPACWYVETATN